ncbi:MAG: hypothetical protein C3F19_02450 [Rhodocyclales bacterium]|nr:MAG: hypothetical protein C3F19_02450 [Rhodocyclales bacterium]
MRSFIAICAALWLAGCASVADAGRLAEVEVVSTATGRKLETWRHDGRIYIAGTPGERYAVRLANRSGGRLLTVLSVDGVNAVTGETAAARQSGYVLGPGQSAEIRGWRKSLDDVAAFYFTALPDAYAARTGRPDNVGVIGVAVFREYVAPRPAPAPFDTLSKQAPDAAGGGRAMQEEARLGTGHGERLNDPTQYTDFRRASEAPAEVLTIYYDSRENLVARGIIPRAPRYAHPQPFPAGFVPDPQG